MKTKTRIETELYFDEEERTHFRVWLITHNKTFGLVADELNISYAYLHAILQGQRRLTPKLISKFEKIGYRITVLPNDKEQEEESKC